MKCKADGFEVPNDRITISGYCNARHHYQTCVDCFYCEDKYKKVK